MKASELIKRLQELVGKYGDNRVVCDGKFIEEVFMVTYKDKIKQQHLAIDLVT